MSVKTTNYEEKQVHCRSSVLRAESPPKAKSGIPLLCSMKRPAASPSTSTTFTAKEARCAGPESHDETHPAETPTGAPSFPTQREHPLYNHVILQIILDMVQVEDLKSCRLVCKFWDDLATPHLLSKGVVSLDSENEEKLAELVSWMNSSTWFPGPGLSPESKRKFFSNILCDKITHFSYPNLFPIIGPQVKWFTVSHWWNDERDLLLEDYEHLLLTQCPNIEFLNIPTTKNFKTAKDFLVCAADKESDVKLRIRTLVVGGELRPSPKFWRIVTLSPDLRALKIYCHISPEFWNPFPVRRVWNERMRNLREVEVKSFGNESVNDDSGNYFLVRKWNLEYITCEAYVLADILFKICYEHIADTLQTLNLSLFNKSYDPWAIDKMHEGILSAALVKMKHFKLSIDDHCHGDIFCRNLINTFVVPNLESVQLVPYDEECNDEWNDGLFSEMLQDQYGPDKPIPVRPALKTLLLPPDFQDRSCIRLLLNTYPNIMELELATPTAPIVTSMFQQWTQLRRLKIHLAENDGTNQTDWTPILAGVNGDSTGTDKDLHLASISNLTKLTSIEIKLTNKKAGMEPLEMPLRDDLIYHGLMKLPVVQNIVIKGHSFSQGAKEALRKSALMFCHMNFTSE